MLLMPILIDVIKPGPSAQMHALPDNDVEQTDHAGPDSDVAPKINRNESGMRRRLSASASDAWREMKCGAVPVENAYPDVIPLGCPHFRRIFQDMPKSQIRAAKKLKPRRRAPILYHGIVVRRPHVAPDTPLPVFRKAVRPVVQRYFDRPVAAE
jgi:hypothetical protein